MLFDKTKKSARGEKMRKVLLVVLVVTLLLGVSFGVASATSTRMKNAVGPATSLTIYNGGLALVREVYKVKLDKGKNEIWFGDFPDTVDPSSIRIKSLNTPDDLVVLEQSFDKNRTIPSFLWMIGWPISKSFIALVHNKYTWNYKIKDKITYEVTGREYHFTKDHMIELSYFVRGITWQTIYRLEILKSAVSENKDAFKFSSWVVITNKSGTGNRVAYRKANIKLVAGDVHQVGGRFYALGEGKAPASHFEERKFFEYHTYTLDKPITLKYDETKLIPLFQKRETGAAKDLVFESQRSKKIQIRLRFWNTITNGLGLPLPAGVVQVFKEDTDGQLEFIGEDQIGHTPKGELIKLYIGNAFDILGEREVLERKSIDAQTWKETIKITLKNYKDEDVNVFVIEHLYGDWEIEGSMIKPLRGSFPAKKDATTLICNIMVPKEEEAIVIYTVRYKR